VRADGLPMSPTFAELTGFGDRLADVLERERVACRMVGVMTYGAMRDFVFQVADSAHFDDVASGVASAHPGPSTVEVRDVRSWSFFEDKIAPKPPNREWISNMRVVAQLQEAGTDPEAEHQLEHFFLGADLALEGVRQELAPRGFVGQEREGVLTLTHPCYLDIDEITTITLNLRRIAQENGAEYDGWGTPVIQSGEA